MSYRLFIIATFLCFIFQTKAFETTTVDSDSATMSGEADDFLRKMPAGLHATQKKAVENAVKGDFSLLDEVRQSRNAAALISENVKVEDLVIEQLNDRQLKLRLYKPEQTLEELPLLIYFHGGGWTFGSINSCSSFCNSLAASGKLAVLAVEYSLSPENPYPQGLMDCVAAVEYTFTHHSELGVSPAKISLGGDSSGGNLALATALYNNDTSHLPISSLVLFYPVVKAETDNSDSWNQYAEGFGLDAGLMTAFNDAYVANTDRNVKAEYVSPIYASDAKLRDLPNTLLVAAQRDILEGQGAEFVSRCADIGGEIHRVLLPGSVHLFITVKGQPTAFQKAVDLTISFLSQP